MNLPLQFIITTTTNTTIATRNSSNNDRTILMPFNELIEALEPLRAHTKPPCNLGARQAFQ
jgi:hypothetical protein